MVDLLQGSRITNLFSISLNDMLASSPVCLLAEASSMNSWLWHHRLDHLNFGTLNELARNDLVRGLPKLKYDKDHLCPSCQPERTMEWSLLTKHSLTSLRVLALPITQVYLGLHNRMALSKDKTELIWKLLVRTHASRKNLL
nr:integrase, catalytic region, zinc finger, CCHC-type, peptidase aspartic, catalytic [Tanacetum cinerariifolium]